ncbi:hypothetical protein Taro_010705 [Colocasia esculenta]|uniref:Uncharacterized protein n=1 Tax=Colocasia esculenta TaxID=4460 RepID=A0A843U3T5_COLES|nr:hypothetical protein [Colocasia esculenta]
MSGLGRRRSPRSRSGRDGGARRDPNRCAFLKKVWPTELWEALLGQEGSLPRDFGRFGVLVSCSACSHREDVVRSGGKCREFVFFTEVWCWLVSTLLWLVLVERQLDLSSVTARLRDSKKRCQ